jgi:hypothetical protein
MRAGHETPCRSRRLLVAWSPAPHHCHYGNSARHPGARRDCRLSQVRGVGFAMSRRPASITQADVARVTARIIN